MKEKIIATYGVCNIGGIAIYNIIFDIDDKVCFRHIYGDKHYKKTYAKIRYDEDRAYFNTHGMKVYLDECMTV